ncbi:hypothetical protein AVEN_76188-1 [Araneus ventricosus]|uniref:Uncharacterized protein n=1 Tax=Araneus ventricosus TaxID=182803 RepID=A0A4Y2EZV2_ARAVE|nr:hypothetical protein AVEN_76188-1 [Araneus ventricosus]
MIFALVATAYAMVDMTQFFEHFAAVGCSKTTASSGTDMLMKTCGKCLRFRVDVRKIDQGMCKNLQG